MLFRGHDLCGCGHSRAPDENVAAALFTASDQLHLLDPSALQNYPLSSTSFAAVMNEVMHPLTFHQFVCVQCQFADWLARIFTVSLQGERIHVVQSEEYRRGSPELHRHLLGTARFGTIA